MVTHWHYDHAFGLAAFADVPRIAHESVHLRLSSAEAAADARRLGLDPQELGQPNVEIAVATALDLGDRRVEIAHLGRGHTDGDLVVVVPDADVLFAGDLLESAGPPSFGPDSVPDEWPATLDAVIGLMTATTLAVPGHGEPVGREFVFEQRGRIAAQAAEIRMNRLGRRSHWPETSLRRAVLSLLTLYTACMPCTASTSHAAWDVDASAH